MNDISALGPGPPTPARGTSPKEPDQAESSIQEGEGSGTVFLPANDCQVRVLDRPLGTLRLALTTQSSTFLGWLRLQAARQPGRPLAAFLFPASRQGSRGTLEWSVLGLSFGGQLSDLGPDVSQNPSEMVSKWASPLPSLSCLL